MTCSPSHGRGRGGRLSSNSNSNRDDGDRRAAAAAAAEEGEEERRGRRRRNAEEISHGNTENPNQSRETQRVQRGEGEDEEEDEDVEHMEQQRDEIEEQQQEEQQEQEEQTLEEEEDIIMRNPLQTGGTFTTEHQERNINTDATTTRRGIEEEEVDMLEDNINSSSSQSQQNIYVTFAAPAPHNNNSRSPLSRRRRPQRRTPPPPRPTTIRREGEHEDASVPRAEEREEHDDQFVQRNPGERREEEEEREGRFSSSVFVGAETTNNTQRSEYGGTPSALRRVQYARCDLGDMGREFLLQDIDMQRLPELPREVVDSDMERKFDLFFDHFKIQDYQGAFDISEEDAAIAALGQNALYCTDTSITGGGPGDASFYSLKLLQYMHQRGASLTAGMAMGFPSSSSSSLLGGGGGRKTYTSNTSCGSLSFDVSLQHLFAFDKCLYTAAVNAPQDAIAAFDAILRRKYGNLREVYGCYTSSSGTGSHAGGDPEEILLQQAPRLRLYGKPTLLMDNLRTLDPSTDIDRLVCLRGIVVRCSEILPEVTLAAFRCQGQKRVGLGEKIPCMQEQYSSVVNGEAIEPSLCRSCGCSQSFSLWIEQCAFASKQLIKLIEAPELLLPGEAPQAVAIYVYDELIDACRPGDRVEITGIYKAAPLRVNPRLRLQHAVFRTYINLVHIRRDDSMQHNNKRSHSSSFSSSSDPSGRGDVEAAAANGENEAQTENPAAAFQTNEARDGEDDDILQGLSADIESRILAVSKRPDIYELLVRSFAPSLFGREEVKKGILCQMVGGTRLSPSSSTAAAGRNSSSEEERAAATAGEGKSFRNGLHVLLCGDPATAKSQLLQYVHKLSPRCIYTSGRGSSAVGLTVSVSKDPETREFVLESGAVVLADGGICCIDEFDKMEDTARAVLHEVMEQQSITVAKAGIVASLRARTSILASANPSGSRYDRNRAVIENINLPPSLFSRFDLIYLLLDTAEASADKQLAQRLCRSFAGKTSSSSSSNRKNSRGTRGDSGERRGREEEEGEERGEEEREEDMEKDEEPPLLSSSFLRLYLAYCRSRCCPRLTAAAATHLRDEYLRMRSRDASSKHPTATVRQLESLVRIAEALAKLRIASKVEASDAVEAVRLMNLATYMSLVDPLSGRIDFDQIHFGQTRQQRMMAQRVADAIKATLAAAGAAATGGSNVNRHNIIGVTREFIFSQVKERMRVRK